MRGAFGDGLIREILGKYFEGRGLGGEAEAALTEKTPEERRLFFRALLAKKIEEEGTDRFIAGILDSTTDAIADLVEDRLDLCSICHEKHGPGCVKHLEDALRQQRVSFRSVRAHACRTYRSADDLVSIATRLLVMLPSSHIEFGLEMPTTEQLRWAFTVAEQLLKEGFERQDRLEREMNPEEGAPR